MAPLAALSRVVRAIDLRVPGRGRRRARDPVLADGRVRAEIDWLDYWRRADDTDPDGVAQRAVEDASSLDPAAVAEAFGQARVDALAAAEDAGGDRAARAPRPRAPRVPLMDHPSAPGRRWPLPTTPPSGGPGPHRAWLRSQRTSRGAV